MADDTGMAHVTFGAGLEPEEAGVIAQDVSDAELDAIAEGAPVLMTVEQLAAIAHHRTT
jgi:hypothetical protein